MRFLSFRRTGNRFEIFKNIFFIRISINSSWGVAEDKCKSSILKFFSKNLSAPLIKPASITFCFTKFENLFDNLVIVFLE